MIDTVTLFIDNTDQTQDFNYSNLSDPKFSINEDTGEMLQSGYFGNLRVKNTGRGFLINGSLAKFLFGNNLESLSVSQTQKVLNNISRELNFRLYDTKVYRLDIGYNFILDHPIQYYMACLGDITRFHKTIYSNYETVQYSNSKRSIIFYDKIREVKKRKVEIPERFQNLENHILRYEVQFKRRLSKEFGFTDSITADYLYNREFLNVALDKWKSHYFAINKIHSPAAAINPHKGAAHLVKSLASIGLTNVGYDEVMGMIASEKSNLKRQTLSRLKKSVRELLIINSDSQGSDYVSELDSKVQAVEIV